MHLFVSSGATVAFDALVRAFTPTLLIQLGSLGFTDVTVQYGHAREAWADVETAANSLGAANAHTQPARLTGFDFAPDLRERVAKADVVVTHAGTGSILDVLRAPGPPKPLVVVVNDALMDNHQLEVAAELAGSQLLVATPRTLEEVLTIARGRAFEPLPAPASLQPLLDEEHAHSRK